MSNFAKSQMLKYGWTEGKGLGKNEDGISQAIKPTLKFDNTGLGYKETFDDFWTKSFDNAAKNIKVESHGDRVSLSVINNNQNTVLPEKNEKKPYQRKRFFKTTLHNDFLKAFIKSEENEATTDHLNFTMTDEEVYAACDGRTAHKTARHALSLSGKQERIEEQDAMLASADCYCETCLPKFNEYTINYNTDIVKVILHNYHKFIELSSKKSNDTKVCTEKLNELSQKLSTCNLEENDAESELKCSKDKRKGCMDCVIKMKQLDALEEQYFFRKKPKLERKKQKWNENRKQESFEQIETGIKKMNIKQEIKQEPGNSYYETKETNKQLGRQSKKRILMSREQCVKFANIWNRMTKMKTKPIDYWSIKQILDVNDHIDLPNNIRNCIINYPWIEMTLRKFDFKMKKKNRYLPEEYKETIKEAQMYWKNKLEKEREEMKKIKSEKIRTQTHLTPV